LLKLRSKVNECKTLDTYTQYAGETLPLPQCPGR
jgi:hypothetical protein